MAIRKYNGKKGKYRAYFKLDGKIHSQVVKTMAEGKAWEIQEKERLKAIKSQKCILMFSSAANEYLVDCKARMQPTTVREKFTHLSELAEFLGQDVALQDVGLKTAKQFAASVQVLKGNKAANRRLRTLKACWNWHKSVLTENPWRYVQPYSEDVALKYIPSAEEVAGLRHIARPWERNFLDVLLLTGARLGEVLGLTWDDVDFEQRAMRLWTRKRKNGSREPRFIPMGEALLSVLQDVKAAYPTSEFVFTNPETGTGYRKLQPSIKNMLSRLCNKADIKAFGFHSLRHYVAMRLMNSMKASVVDIQILLGHQRATTTDGYLRTLSSGIRHIASVLDEEVILERVVNG